eukprot:31278-Pelagococcus_subviridis.AAC.12
MYITKFVLCPVVDSRPARVKVLYAGQLYTPSLGGSRFRAGSNHINGKSVYSSFGRLSAS